MEPPAIGRHIDLGDNNLGKEVGNANKLYERTVIVVYAPKLYTLRYLVGQFGITANYQILFDPDPTSSADIEVRVGADWLNIIPES